MKDKKQTLLLIVSVAIFAGLLVVFLMRQIILRQAQDKGLREERGEEAIVEASPTVPPIPTKTEEEKEIIRNIETLEVKITANGFEPDSLTIKPNDQVDWVNETSEDYKVVGEDWGGVTIRAGRRFTQSFEKAGVYPYSCELHPEKTGEIRIIE